MNMKCMMINLLNQLFKLFNLNGLQNEAFGEAELLRRQGVLIPVFIKKDRIPRRRG